MSLQDSVFQREVTTFQRLSKRNTHVFIKNVTPETRSKRSNSVNSLIFNPIAAEFQKLNLGVHLESEAARALVRPLAAAV